MSGRARCRRRGRGRRRADASRVGLGVQRNVARLGQHHQLGKVAVRADEVADDVDLRGDDVDRRDADRAAVADHDNPAGTGEPYRGTDFGPLLGDEIDDDLGTEPARQVQDLVDLAAVGRTSSSAPSSLASTNTSGLRSTTISATSRPGAECRCGPARRRPRPRRSCPGRAVAAPCGLRGTRSAQRRRGPRTSAGRVDGSSGTQARALVSKYWAMPPWCCSRERAARTVHVVARSAGSAKAARRRGMEDHGVIGLHVGDRGADLRTHPAFMPERVGQGDILSRPLALDRCAGRSDTTQPRRPRR